eukprot:12053851-Alexandrium_andersonii.AAC.1
MGGSSSSPKSGAQRRGRFALARSCGASLGSSTAGATRRGSEAAYWQPGSSAWRCRVHARG